MWRTPLGGGIIEVNTSGGGVGRGGPLGGLLGEGETQAGVCVFNHILRGHVVLTAKDAVRVSAFTAPLPPYPSVSHHVPTAYY